MNLSSPPSYLDSSCEMSSKRRTDITTYHPFLAAYYKAANQNTCDVIYPPQPPLAERTESREKSAMLVEYAEQRVTIVQRYCGSKPDVMNFMVDMIRHIVYMEEHRRYDKAGAYLIGTDDKSRQFSWDREERVVEEQKEKKE